MRKVSIIANAVHACTPPGKCVQCVKEVRAGI